MSLAAEPAATHGLQRWVGDALVAGLELNPELSNATIQRKLDELKAEHVSVVEVDSDLSWYLDEEAFAEELALIRRTVRLAHARGLRIVWYYPVLEVLTPDAEKSDHTMYKDHPDWVQRGLTGLPNVFYGGGGRIHWVEPGVESAWMSIHSPYRDYFFERVRRLARSGLDGLWFDVPLLNDVATSWADASDGARDKFKDDTGLEVPKAEDWSEPAWRRWIAWRSDEVARFLREAAAVARREAPQFTVVVENVTVDHYGAVLLGLDGSLMKDADGLMQVWEIDSVSDRTAMREASDDDWTCVIGMMKFARSASGDKPSWVFTYGEQVQDAETVMALALATGNHPYETKIPEMMSTVSVAFRHRMYEWATQEKKRLFASSSAADVAILFSRPSRNYTDMGRGWGIYASTRTGDELWWSREPSESIYHHPYLSEYRGLAKWLSKSHVPFDTLVAPTAAELSRYRVVLAPSMSAVSDAELALLPAYVEQGGHLVFTGMATPARRDALGTERPDRKLPWLEPLLASATTGANSRDSGNGRVSFLRRDVGRDVLLSGTSEGITDMHEILGEKFRPVQSSPGDNVHFELHRLDDELLLHAVRRYVPDVLDTTPVVVSWRLPAGLSVRSVHVSTPSGDGKPHAIGYQVTDGTITFEMPVTITAMAIIKIAGRAHSE